MRNIDRNGLLAIWGSLLVVITDGDIELLLVGAGTFLLIFVSLCLIIRGD